ncbi:hypothetical protein HAX54_032133 [Datura stramonium]|uniref:Peptidase A1 domain-containing protein n=1 Tax=Datura stramonium TaxID=4076 RepID=A0ABS8SCG5_DATST|nr:hypothetical protein [Datura stramonium]
MSLDPSKLPDPPMPSYTFTIYHRDVFEKSKFKNYDSLLENRLARCQARADYLASIFEDVNNVKECENATLTWEQDARGGKIREKVPKTTSTYFAHGEYVASFLLGSNEVRSLLQIDTGSDLLWWQCGPCEANKCYKQINPLYVPTNSKTFRKIDCIVHGSRCLDDLDPTYECNVYNNQCTYDIKFTSGQRSKGFMADDVITFVLDQRPIRVTFGCGKDQMGRKNFSGEYSGIAGLGRRVKSGSYSLPSQFRADLMSICLPGFYSGKASALSFHTATWPRTTGAGGVHVDTGTTITRFPRDLYIVFRYIFRAEIGDIPMVKSPFKSLDTCYKADSDATRELYFPVVKLYFGGVNPKHLLLLAKERVMARASYLSSILEDDNDVKEGGNSTLLTRQKVARGGKIRELVPKSTDTHCVNVGPFDTCYEEDPNGNNNDLHFPIVKLYFGSISPSTMLLLTHERVMVKYRGFYCLAFIGMEEKLHDIRH